MKKLIHLSVLAFVLFSRPFLNPASAQFDSMNYVLPGLREPYSTLNQSRIPSGLLHDRTLDLSSIRNYKGNGNSTAGAMEWLQVYQEMYNASFTPLPTDLSTIQSRCENYLEQGKNPLLIQCFSYNKIKPGAIDSGYLDTAGGYFYDGPVTSSSPYSSEIAFSFTPAVHSFADNAITFILAQDLYFSNLGSLPTEIWLDFDDGMGWQLLQFGDEVLVNYPNSNPRQLKILVKYSSAVQFTGSGMAKKMDPLPTKLMKKGSLQFAELLPSYFTSSRQYITKKESGIATVKFGYDASMQLHQCLVKPLIIVEGIDFGYRGKSTSCFSGKCGTLGFIDFYKGQLHNFYDGTILPFPEIEKSDDMIKQLTELGYDIIYLDFEDGATFMQDNAMLLVELIEEVNKQKCSDEPLVIIGASMGGQIAKFALSYMENRNIPHCSRLYISFDSPHQGANVPIGIQHYIKAFTGVSSAADDAVNRILTRPATRQLLLNHFEQDQRDIVQTHWARSWWLSDLAIEGNYPEHTRNIAIANGSGNGTTQPFSGGAKLYEWYTALSMLGEIWAAPGVDVGKSYLLVARIKLPFSPEKLIKVHNHGMPAYDHCPGSTRNNFSEFAPPPYGTAVAHWPRQSFIPTVSSLDYNNTNFFTNIKGTGNVKYYIPFDDYYLQDDNQPHVQMTLTGTPSAPGTGNVDWAIQQILKNEDELPYQLYSNYNYGSEFVTYLNSVKINNQARLHVNGNYPTKFGTGPLTLPGSNFNLFTLDCAPVVTVANGGILELGEKGSTNNKGTVYFRKGSTLEILPEGILIINDNSRLIIEEGANLIFHPGAQILLDGNDAVLQISGKLTVKDAAIFTFKHSPGIAGGYIRFIKENTGNLRISCEGYKAEIDLHGDNCSDKFMEIINCSVEPEHNAISPLHNFKLVRLHTGTISYGKNAELRSGSASDIFGLVLKRSGANYDNTGLRTYGQAGLLINAVTFDGLDKGLVADNHIYGNPVHISGSRFFSCRTAFHNSDISFVMEDCYFKNCSDYGINAFISMSSQMLRCIIKGDNSRGIPTGTGISLHSMNGASLSMLGCSFNTLDNAVYLSGDQPLLLANCVNFNGNRLGIFTFSIDAHVNLSRNYYIQGNNGGGCIFNDNGTAISMTGRLFLENGNNNFYSSKLSAPQFIYANIQFNQAQLSGANLSAQGNYFSPALQNNPAWYKITYVHPIYFHQVPVTLANVSSAPLANSCSDFNMFEQICMGLGKKSETVNAAISSENLKRRLDSGNDPEIFAEADAGLAIYPNPADDIINIRGIEESVTVSVNIYDMTGRKMADIGKAERTDASMHAFRLPQLNDGAYIIEIIYSDKVRRQPLLIRH